MWFDTPAANWIQSLPAGNGHIGCMIFNDPVCDRLCLNDDTLWSGYARDYSKKDFKENLDKVRALMAKGSRVEAEKIVETHLTHRFTQAFLPLGDIVIRSKAGIIEKYRRELDMSEGVIHARYNKNGNFIKTETFVSYPYDVMIHVIQSQTSLDYEISFESPIVHDCCFDKKGFTVKGHAPSDVIIKDVSFFGGGNELCYEEMHKSVRFAARAEIISDGDILAGAGKLTVVNATKTAVIYSSATSFSHGDGFEKRCKRIVTNAGKAGIQTIRKAHIEDHFSLFGRVDIELGADDASCAARHARMRSGEINPSDIGMLFQYGRYLLIAASREGTQPANLQGIWNKELIPPWWSGYTLNINLQMNYWLADRTNLSDCFEPLVAYVKRLCEVGKQTARKDYGAKGAVAHHQSDIWSHSTPVGYGAYRIPQSARWMMWNMPLPWLSIQLFDHYLYTRDDNFLKAELLPIMKNAADFIMSHFTEIDGKMYNIPTTSPENMYLCEAGKELAICNISAIDIGIAREFFDAYVYSCRRVGDSNEADRCAAFAERVENYAISKRGELLEWDKDYEEPEKGHRHFSMLFGIYPGSHLIGSEYAAAARKSLDNRLQNGSGQTGWSAVWAMALLARFGEGEAAYGIIKKLVRENIHENMFGAHPPDFFQIDTNYGFTAAVCEMILQEYGGIIRLLPALPRQMESGSIRGLLIHSGHTISLAWKASKVISLEISAKTDDEIVIDASHLVSERAQYSQCPQGICIVLKAGERYHFYA